MKQCIFLLLLLVLGCARPEIEATGEYIPLGRGDADVEFVKATQNADGTWIFTVTVRHDDTGWDNYADGWNVVADGVVIKKNSDDQFTRVITHPHVDEQPFTRSQSGLVIEEDVVVVRAHDSVDGYGGKEVVVDLRKNKGDDFEAESN